MAPASARIGRRACLNSGPAVMAIRARRFAELTIDGAVPPAHDFH